MFFRNRRVFESVDKVDYAKNREELEQKAEKYGLSVEAYLDKVLKNMDGNSDEKNMEKMENIMKPEKSEEQKTEINTLETTAVETSSDIKNAVKQFAVKK